MVKLAAATTDGFSPPEGGATLSALRMVPCDNGDGEVVDLGGRRLDFVGWKLVSPDALEVPEGTWCGMTLALSTFSIDTTYADFRFYVELNDIEVSLSGRELEVDGQELGLQLARNGWLSALLERADPDAGDVIVTDDDPEGALLSTALEQTSGLFLETDDLEDPNAGQAFPPGDDQDGSVWSGDQREPATGSSTPSTVFLPVFEGVFFADTMPAIDMDFSGAVLAVGVVQDTSTEGVLLEAPDPLGGQPFSIGQATSPSVGLGINSPFALAYEASGVGITVADVGDGFPADQYFPSANPTSRSPSLAGDGDRTYVAWRDDDRLLLSTLGAPDGSGELIADSVTAGPAVHLTASNDLAVAWAESFPNPVSGAIHTAIVAATYDNDGDWNLALLSTEADGAQRIRNHANSAGHVVSWDDGSGQHVVWLDALGQVVRALDLQVDAVDAAMLGSRLLVVTTSQKQSRVQLFDAVGPSIEATFPLAGTEVALAVAPDGSPRLAWVTVGPDGAFVQGVEVLEDPAP